uniref:Uncharacterized protein n=1 Tax=Candidatus Caldatribacterium saccharofermentans TaxID=1454753 RepID=A0A7V4WKS0_9BACT
MTPRDFITLLVAVYGAFLSTFALVRQTLRERPKLVVRFSPQPLDPVMHWKSGFNPQGFYFLEGVNTGEKDIVLSNFGVAVRELRGRDCGRISDKLFLLLEPRESSFPGTPLTLKPGEKISFAVNVAELQGVLASFSRKRRWKVRGFFEDSLGRRYWSPPGCVHRKRMNPLGGHTIPKRWKSNMLG